jgi:Holliday junction resolvasome RuvABC endonuclease subunit
VRVLGVDPGLTRCGLGVVDGVPGRVALVAVGVARTPADAEVARKVFRLIDALEDSDDVQNVYTNLDISPEVQAQLDEDDE